MIVHHPETVSSGPQLFQTFTVHRNSVKNVALTEKHLVSGKKNSSLKLSLTFQSYCPILVSECISTKFLNTILYFLITH